MTPKSKFARFALYILFAIVGTTTVNSPAEGAQPIGNDWKFCDEATRSVEQTSGIPKFLLKAISLTETGRWMQENKANVAWPWTVTSGGAGKFFPNRESALVYVKRLQGRGVTNIDVGCMQINLHYHGSAFASIEDAIDPLTNVKYAAKFLKRLYRKDRSWTEAASHYHSTTPDRARAYKFRVIKNWGKTRRMALRSVDRTIDYQRMAALNASRKKALANSDPSSGDVSIQDQMHSSRKGGLSYAQVAAMQRARKEGERQKLFRGDKKMSKLSFANKRRQHLQKWRLGLPNGSSQGG